MREKYPVPQEGGEGLGGLPVAERGGRGRQGLPNHPGAGPLCSLAGGAQVGLWVPAGTLVPAVPPSPPQPLALPISQHGRDRTGPWGQSLRDTWPRKGAQWLCHLLSPLQHACCVAGQMLTRTSAAPYTKGMDSVPTRFAW